MKNNFTKNALSLALIVLLSFGTLLAQDEYEGRISAGLRFKPAKKVRLYVTPEIRINDNGVDKLIGEIKVKYSPIKILDLGTSYEAIVNKKNDGSNELIHRITVFSQVEHKIERFTPALRIMYTNYNEDDGLSNFLKARVRVNYNIRKSKIDPYASVELYYGLEDGLYKWRYAAGAEWRLNGDHSINLGYKLDSYINSDRLKHIVELGYSFKF